MMTFMIADTIWDIYSRSKKEIFFMINGIIISVSLIVSLIWGWVSWSNKTLDKPENHDKPIIEHIQER